MVVDKTAVKLFTVGVVLIVGFSDLLFSDHFRSPGVFLPGSKMADFG